MSEQTLEIRKIQERYKTLAQPFPRDDIKKVIPDDRDMYSLFHTYVDLYCANIAGYSYRADRLGRRPEEDLRKAKISLSQPFFDRYPEFAPLKEKISLKETPNLFQKMEAAELNRVDLQKEVERLLNRST